MPIRRSEHINTKPRSIKQKNAKSKNKKQKSLKLLFADDEPALQELMSLELPAMGHEVTVCPDGLTAVAAIERNSYDCIIVDLDMPGLTGIEVIEQMKRLSPNTDAIVLTGKATTDSAVGALRNGAFDYLTKPCKLLELDALLQRVADKRELTNKYRALRHRLERIEGTSELIGESACMKTVGKLIAKVAPTGSTVLVLGETGTGKELAARALHDQSPRAEMPFVAINCGALPATLIESELFGHRKGSFTGADDHRIGLFEVADGGTIFLDEIGELPKSMQAKLLRVLESGEIRPVGENESKRVDVRVICATHRDLDEMVDEGAFREDLMFRINAFEIQLPALRQRIDDVPRLAHHLLGRFSVELASEKQPLSPATLDLLTSHSWPGNVRELANVIEHATILCEQGPITPEHLPARFMSRHGRGAPPTTLREIEMAAIHDSLDRFEGDKPKVAEELGVSLKTLYNKLNSVAALDKSA